MPAAGEGVEVQPYFVAGGGLPGGWMPNEDATPKAAGERGRPGRPVPRWAAILALLIAASPAVAADESTGSPWRWSAQYTGEYQHNLRGGLERGGAYLDNLDLMLEVDGERAFGVPGLTAMAYALYNNGGSITGRYVGDAQFISNIEATRALRLYELWADWRFGAAQAHSVRFGLYDLNSEFDVSEVALLFLNGVQGIGIDFSQAGLNGPPIFPLTALAARLEWAPAEGWRVRGAVLDGVPGDPERPKVTPIKLSSEDGALLVAEIDRATEAWHVVVGHWRYTTTFDDLEQVDEAGDPLRRRGSHGTYAFVEGSLWRAKAGPRRLTGVARVGVASPDVNPIQRTLRLGLVLHSPFTATREDQLGLAFATYRNGDPYLRGAAANGEALLRGETNVELTWRVPVTDWLALQPALQWVRHPGSLEGIDDAWVAGLRFEVGGASH
jgi:porin